MRDCHLRRFILSPFPAPEFDDDSDDGDGTRVPVAISQQDEGGRDVRRINVSAL